MIRVRAFAVAAACAVAGTAGAQNAPQIHPASVDAGGGRCTASNVVVQVSLGSFGGVSGNRPGDFFGPGFDGTALSASERSRVTLCHGFTGQTLKMRPLLGLPTFQFPDRVIFPVFGEDDLTTVVETATTLPFRPPGTTNLSPVLSGRTINGVRQVIHSGVAFNPHRFYRARSL